MNTEARRKANRRWKKAHPEAVKAEKRRYRQRHREQINEYYRKYSRNRRIVTTINGIHKEYPAPNKRPYPTDNQCEICRKLQKHSLKYHHLDDADFSKGMWVCMACHKVLHHLIRLRNK